MAIYESVKCPNCDNRLKFMKQKTSHGAFGTPLIKCQFCSKLINTGKKLWRDLSFGDKFLFYLSLIGTSFFWGMIFFMISLYGMNYFDPDNEFLFHITISTSILISIYLIYKQQKNLKELITLYEEDYDNKSFKYQDY